MEFFSNQSQKWQIGKNFENVFQNKHGTKLQPCLKDKILIIGNVMDEFFSNQSQKQQIRKNFRDIFWDYEFS